MKGALIFVLALCLFLSVYTEDHVLTTKAKTAMKKFLKKNTLPYDRLIAEKFNMLKSSLRITLFNKTEKKPKEVYQEYNVDPEIRSDLKLTGNCLKDRFEALNDTISSNLTFGINLEGTEFQMIVQAYVKASFKPIMVTERICKKKWFRRVCKKVRKEKPVFYKKKLRPLVLAFTRAQLRRLYEKREKEYREHFEIFHLGPLSTIIQETEKK